MMNIRKESLKILFWGLCAMLPLQSFAGVINVTTPYDDGTPEFKKHPGISLRQALDMVKHKSLAGKGKSAQGSAESTEVPDTIMLNSALGTTYSLHSTYYVNSTISIAGNTNYVITVDNPGQSNYRAFEVQNGGSLTITKATLMGGDVSNNSDSNGGCIKVNAGGSLQLSNVTIQNSVASCGGGIYNEGTISLSNTTLSANQATVGGGGLYNDGIASINASTISNNKSTTNNGREVFQNSGTLCVANCIIATDVQQTTGTDFHYQNGQVNDLGCNIIKISNADLWGNGYNWLYNTSTNLFVQNNNTNAPGNLNLSTTLQDNGGGINTLGFTGSSIAQSISYLVGSPKTYITQQPDQMGNNQGYGRALALSQDRSMLVAGVPYRQNGGVQNGGGADIYKYDKANDTYNIVQSFSSTIEGIGLGSVVDISKDTLTIVLGSERPRVGTETLSSTGGCVQIYRYSRSFGQYLLFQTLQQPSGCNAARYGSSVRLVNNGNMLIVGALGNYGGESNPGNAEPMVFVYTKDQDLGIYYNTQIIADPSPYHNSTAQDSFSYQIAASADGSVLAISDPRFDIELSDNPNTDPYAGRVYIYLWDKTLKTYTLQKTLKRIINVVAPEPEDIGHDLYGTSLIYSQSEDRLLCGGPKAIQPKLRGGSYVGVVESWLYNRNTQEWSCRNILPDSTMNGCEFGKEIALANNGNLLIVPVKGVGNDGQNTTGHIAFFHLKTGSNSISLTGIAEAFLPIPAGAKSATGPITAANDSCYYMQGINTDSSTDTTQPAYIIGYSLYSGDPSTDERNYNRSFSKRTIGAIDIDGTSSSK